jgi:CubicO group peptidase (beta-lactamase class C family)
VPRSLDNLAAALVAAGPPGALVAVDTAGAVRFGAAGEARRGTTPMTWDVRTDAGSITKVAGTTAALMSLVDAGEVALDDPVPAAGTSATVRTLLEHRAGLWEWWPLYLTARGADAIDLIGRLPLRHSPGAGRHYSDLGLILLGDLVSRLAGRPLAEAVAARALRPFGLTETAFGTPVPGAPVAASSPGDIIERTMIETGEPYPVTGDAAGFPRWRTHDLVGEVNDGNAFHAFGGVAGHAGLFTTATDLLRFARGMLDSLAGHGPVSTGTARTFTTAGADPVQALGFRRWHTAAGPVIGHTGFPGVAFGLVPRRDTAIVMITNRLHAPGLCWLPAPGPSDGTENPLLCWLPAPGPSDGTENPLLCRPPAPGPSDGTENPLLCRLPASTDQMWATVLAAVLDEGREPCG